MAEYIERSDAASFFENSKQTMWHKDDIAATISSKKNIPAADVAEVVHGEWIGIEPYCIFECSNCAYEWYLTNLQEHPLLNDANYCPNCGAKMDGERRKEDG